MADRKVYEEYERLLAEMQAADPEEYERYLEAVKLTDPTEDDRDLDDLLEVLRSAPIHPPRGKSVPPTPPSKH